VTRALAALALFVAVMLSSASPALACSANRDECGNGPHPNVYIVHP
jgi:hypothetical protein